MRDAGLGLISVVWGLTALYIADAETRRRQTKPKQNLFTAEAQRRRGAEKAKTRVKANLGKTCFTAPLTPFAV
jgi:hypothetical protein